MRQRKCSNPAQQPGNGSPGVDDFHSLRIGACQHFLKSWTTGGMIERLGFRFISQGSPAEKRIRDEIRHLTRERDSSQLGLSQCESDRLYKYTIARPQLWAVGVVHLGAGRPPVCHEARARIAWRLDNLYSRLYRIGCIGWILLHRPLRRLGSFCLVHSSTGNRRHTPFAKALRCLAQKLRNRPDVIGQTGSHSRRAGDAVLQAAVAPAEIEVSREQADRVPMVLNLPAESECTAREAPIEVADGKIASLNTRRVDGA